MIRTLIMRRTYMTRPSHVLFVCSKCGRPRTKGRCPTCQHVVYDRVVVTSDMMYVWNHETRDRVIDTTQGVALKRKTQDR